MVSSPKSVLPPGCPSPGVSPPQGTHLVVGSAGRVLDLQRKTLRRRVHHEKLKKEKVVKDNSQNMAQLIASNARVTKV